MNLRHIFWRVYLSGVHPSFWRGMSEIQVMKLKFVHAIKFWRGRSVHAGVKPFMKWTPGGGQRGFDPHWDCVLGVYSKNREETI